MGGVKMRLLNTATILCASIILFLPSIVKASPVGTIDIAHTGYGAKGTLKVWGGGLDGVEGYGGVYMQTKSDGSGQGNLWPDGLVGTFCIELQETTSSSALTYDVVMLEDVYNSFIGGPIGTEKAEYLSELWGRFFDPDWMSGGSYTYQQKRDAEAFASAVWEIIYEDIPGSPSGWDVTVDGTAGDLGFRAENVNSTTANNWLHSLTGYGPKADLRAFAYEGKQDFIAQVPEPTTVCLLGLGGLFFLRKRK